MYSQSSESSSMVLPSPWGMFLRALHSLLPNKTIEPLEYARSEL